MATSRLKHLRPNWHISGYGGVIYDREEWLYRLRRGSALTCAEIGERVGLASQSVSRLLQAKHDDPKVETLQKLATVLGEGIWAAFGYPPIGWRRGRSKAVWWPPQNKQAERRYSLRLDSQADDLDVEEVGQ
jgi:transcriptional regulator with XRE-family HTH domain